MRTAEIRQRWLDYFIKRDHHIAPPMFLVSPNPSILFTVAKMVPFTPYTLNTEPAPQPAVAPVQKCIRTNNIDNVGRTTRHGTFLQMSGNFSFGDYFKEGAIDLTWGLLASLPAEEGYGLDDGCLWITTWEEDAVFHDYQARVIGPSSNHIQKLPFKEISWSTGQPEPVGAYCGIHYDRGPKCGLDGDPATDVQGGRFLEIWNLVFSEFVRDEGGGHDPELVDGLERTATDTGASLERIAYLLQGRASVHEIDEVYLVIRTTEEIAGKRCGVDVENDVCIRVMADHVCPSLMLIGNGVRSDSGGHGYVLRWLTRRAMCSIHLLDVDDVVLSSLVAISKGTMKDSYLELRAEFPRILDVASAGEVAFRRTFTSGTQIFDLAAPKASSGNKVLSGEGVFVLHDAYGFPVDLILETASEQGLKVDEGEFRWLMQEQKNCACANAWAKKANHVDSAVYNEILDESDGLTRLLGYSEIRAEGKTVVLLVDGASTPVTTAPAGVDVALDQAPLYVEMDGRLVGRGMINVEGGGLVQIDDVQSPVKSLNVHHGTVSEGTVAIGEKVFTQINVDRRGQTAGPRTSTHMIHKAFHELLGERATQVGPENSPPRLRFDFRHGEQIPAGVVMGTERRVNDRLREDLEATDEIMGLDRA